MLPSERGVRWGHRVGRFLARGVWNTTVVGTENVPPTGPVVLAANHTGVIDGPIVVGVSPRPVRMLVKEAAFRGVVGTILRRTGQIPVDASGRSALAAALEELKRGGVVGIFPEGSRGRGDLMSARAGAAWLALGSGATVVPVAVLGTRRTGEGVSHVPGLRRRLHVEFGPGITVARRAGVSGRVALEEANEAVRAALSEVVARATSHSGIALPDDGPDLGGSPGS